MYLLAWIFIGVLVGWGTGRILVGHSFGPFMDVAMGVAGAVSGGYLLRSVGFRGPGGTIATITVAVAGAGTLTILGGLVSGRRIHVRQF
jgi:uncharacterized membrane protein YeaQ/YmgE (transglycosylase-associated protein family)